MNFFTIKNHQLESLNKVEEEKLVNRLITFTKQQYPEWSLKKGDIELRNFILEIFAFAEKYHFTEERIYMELIDLEINFSIKNFIPYPDVQERILSLRDKEQYEKLNYLKNYLQYQLENE